METVKTWTVIRALVEVEPEDWAALANVFEEHGIHGTLLEDRPPAIVGYAHRSFDIAPLVADLERTGASKVELDEIVEQDWSETWKQFFKPMKVGNRLWIKPSWEELPKSDDRLIIEIDPGQAFGTGDHPTTRLCLQMLEEVDPTGKSVADVGCGSGILSIAALLLGAKRVVAIDLDPASVESTQENFERNDLKGEVVQGDGFEPLKGRTFEIVLSNIISATLIRVASDAHAVVAPGGWWVLSGVIAQNWPDVQRAAESLGFQLERHEQEGEWIAAIFRR